MPSAGTAPSIAWARHPNTTSGSIWPVTWRTATGAGYSALRIVPGGAVTRIGTSDPALLGTRGATMQRTPNEV